MKAIGTGKVCVVGAGLSGVAAARALAARGIPFDCFDRREEVGGVCTSPSPPRLDVSRERLQFSDRPMPGSYPRLPAGRHLAAYLREYCDHFELRASISPGIEVRHALRRPAGGWEVELDTGERRAYAALLVAAGRRGGPERGDVPRGFGGEQRYGRPPPRREEMEGRDVLLVGGDAGTFDLASEASYVARSTTLSIRRSRSLLPQIVAGRPLDATPGLDYLRGKGLGRGGFSPRIPRRLRRGMLGALHASVSSPALHGLPRPGDADAVPAPQLLERLLHGRVEVRPAVTRVDRDLVHFADGSAARVDLIVWGGSRPRFPFLGLTPGAGSGPLLGVFAAPDLAFLGLAEPVAGSPTAVAELQARWVAAAFAGDYALPAEGRCGRDACSAPRLERVEQHEYARDVERELRAGCRRARLRTP